MTSTKTTVELLLKDATSTKTTVELLLKGATSTKTTVELLLKGTSRLMTPNVGVCADVIRPGVAVPLEL